MFNVCICTDCHWVDRCNAYHAVEKQHQAQHLSKEPDFYPINPKIVITISGNSSESINTEWDVRSCESFALDLGRWMKLRPGLEVPT